MSALARILQVVLIGLAGLVLRKLTLDGSSPPRKPADEPAPEPPSQEAAPASDIASPPAPESPTPLAQETNSAGAPRKFTYGRAPRIASIGARSLPVIGVLSTVITLVLAMSAVAGEIAGFRLVEDPNLAWAAALVTISIWAVYLLWRVPQWQANAWARQANASPRELFEIENDSRGTLGQILSGVAVLTGLIFAWQQLGQTSDNLRVSEEGQITDRFSRAVDQLGSDQFTIRLGGIYALERIARDSPRDYGPVMEVLTAFARQESPAGVNASATPGPLAPQVPADVQAVFKVIGRRSEAQIMAELDEGYGCLDLTGISAVGVSLVNANLQNTCWNGGDLRGAIFSGADLTGASFGSANLQQANLDRVYAEGAQFNSANLIFANLSQGNFTGANFLAAKLNNAILQGTDLDDANLLQASVQNAQAFGATLNGANLLNTDLTGALLADADLSGAEQLTADQVTSAVTSSGTRLPPDINVPPDF